MAVLTDNKFLFMTTSPRTAEKMIPEIQLLDKHFHGQIWNSHTQSDFMSVLRDEDFFVGTGSNDPAFSARDRINRAPKALGFVVLSPTIELTTAGKALIASKHTEDVFLRQMLKFQLPSPYHRANKLLDISVKPYLEIFRLIRYFGTLHFEELQYFGMQMTNYKKFDSIVQQIEQYRIEKSKAKGKNKAFQKSYFDALIQNIYSTEIQQGKIKIRENHGKSVEHFVITKQRNLRDYTDACIRYLRATGLVNISHIGRSLSIAAECVDEVDYFLKNVSRDPIFIDNEKRYVDYLGNVTVPALLEKDYEQLRIKKEHIIQQEIAEIKDYKQYTDIDNMFTQIETNHALYDAPLMLEWNTWRAMTMLDGGNIKANLKFDDFGKPMSTAIGNTADIVCDYGDFNVIVEVTMATGQRQYETEGEPVSRHLAKIKKETGKPAYCLFIAPNINPWCIAHFYGLHKINISLYGGTSEIVPLPLSIFRKMVEDSYKAEYVPNPSHVRSFFEWSANCAKNSASEQEWYSQLENKARTWLSAF